MRIVLPVIIPSTGRKINTRFFVLKIRKGFCFPRDNVVHPVISALCYLVPMAVVISVLVHASAAATSVQTSVLAPETVTVHGVLETSQGNKTATRGGRDCEAVAARGGRDCKSQTILNTGELRCKMRQAPLWTTLTWWYHVTQSASSGNVYYTTHMVAIGVDKWYDNELDAVQKSFDL